MTTLSFILSIYAAILSTILMVRWIRLGVVRRKVSRQLAAERSRDEQTTKEAFIHPFPPPLFSINQPEEEGEVTPATELDVEFERSEVDEPSVEEREWEEEQRTLRRMGVKGI